MKLVGSTSQGECSCGNLAFKKFFLKGQGRGVCCVWLPPDPLPISCTSSAMQRCLGMPDLESHWLAERLAYLGQSLTWESASAERPFVIFLGSVTFHNLGKSYIAS